jgi:hypothetical protein
MIGSTIINPENTQLEHSLEATLPPNLFPGKVLSLNDATSVSGALQHRFLVGGKAHLTRCTRHEVAITLLISPSDDFKTRFQRLKRLDCPHNILR